MTRRWYAQNSVDGGEARLSHTESTCNHNKPQATAHSYRN
jgi:hypothetical protein